jgi:hypothetical protein
MILRRLERVSCFLRVGSIPDWPPPSLPGLAGGAILAY